MLTNSSEIYIISKHKFHCQWNSIEELIRELHKQSKLLYAIINLSLPKGSISAVRHHAYVAEYGINNLLPI